MFLSAYGRPATSEELAGATAYLKEAARLLRKGEDDPATWGELAHAIFQTREFIFLN